VRTSGSWLYSENDSDGRSELAVEPRCSNGSRPDRHSVAELCAFRGRIDVEPMKHVLRPHQLDSHFQLERPQGKLQRCGERGLTSPSFKIGAIVQFGQTRHYALR